MSDRQARRADIAQAVYDLGTLANRLIDYQRTDPDVVDTELGDLIEAAATVLRIIDRVLQRHAP